VLLWLAQRLVVGIPQSGLRLYFELFYAVMSGAVTDKVITDNPRDGIKLSQVFRGLGRAPKWVPNPGRGSSSLRRRARALSRPALARRCGLA